MPWLHVLRGIRAYGNNPPGPGVVPGLKGTGAPVKVGFKSAYKIRASLHDLLVHHKTLTAFKESFATRAMAANNGVPVPLEIVGIDTFPPVELKIVTSGAQVGIQGATYLASKFIGLKKLGSTDGKETFVHVHLGSC